jgi:epoxide hydrolase-like predicted phosphatase
MAEPAAAAEPSGAVRSDPAREGRYRGLLVDFGGVLTTDVFASFRAFSEAEGLAPETVRQRFRDDPRGRELLFDLELGRLSEAQFQPAFAELLGVAPEGLIDRLFGGMAPDDEMVAAVRAARVAGVRTGLISNSWGAGRYDRAQLAELFDGVVISADEGLRKPDPEIYELGAKRVGLAPVECVFVDDLPGNLKPALELGMATVHHRRTPETVAALEDLLGVPLTHRVST